MAGRRPPPPGFLPSLSSFPSLSSSSGPPRAAATEAPSSSSGPAWAVVAGLPPLSASAAVAAAAAGLGMPGAGAAEAAAVQAAAEAAAQAAIDLELASVAAAGLDPVAAAGLDPVAAAAAARQAPAPAAGLDSPASAGAWARPLMPELGALVPDPRAARPLQPDPRGVRPVDPLEAHLGPQGPQLGPHVPPRLLRTDTAASAEAALTAALLAAQTEAAAAQERVRVAALAWERERTTAETLARRVAEAEHFLSLSGGKQPVVDIGASSPQAAPPRSASRPDPTDPLVAQLHLQAAGVQNIRALVSVVLDPTSSFYGRWRDQVLLALRRYALDDHVTTDTPAEGQDPLWLRLDSVVLSWIFGTISLDLQDIVRAPDITARQAWLVLEGQFLGNREHRALRLDARFRTYVQGDQSVGEYCRRMKGMADELHDLGCPVSDRILVLNVLRGLNDSYELLRTWIPRQRPFPSFQQVQEDLTLDEISRGLSPTTPPALVAAPPVSSAPPATSLLGAPPPGPSGGGAGRGGGGGGGGRRRRGRGGGGGRGGGRGGGGGGAQSSAPSSTLGSAPWPSFANPWSGRISMWPFQTSRGGTRPLHQPAAMLAGLVPPSLAGWVPPPQQMPWTPTPQPPTTWAPTAPTWPGWDQAALAQSFSTMGLTPPVTAEWIADSGASFHTTPDAGFGFPASSSPL
ncbi:unnamed protein product [Urochloa humidicola]